MSPSGQHPRASREGTYLCTRTRKKQELQEILGFPGASPSFSTFEAVAPETAVLKLCT